MTSRTDIQSQPTRREKERLARRQLILDAACVVFAQRGFHSAKLEEVAERAEFGKATLYSYFDTKETLFQAVLEDVFDNLLRRARESFAGSAPFEEKIARYAASETEYFFHNPEALHLMIGESLHLRGRNPLIRLMPQYMAVLQSAIEREQKAKRFRRDLDAFELAAALRFLVFAQILGRIHRLMLELGMIENIYDDQQLLDLTERVKATDVQQEITRATTFITSVFLRGVVA